MTKTSERVDPRAFQSVTNQSALATPNGMLRRRRTRRRRRGGGWRGSWRGGARRGAEAQLGELLAAEVGMGELRTALEVAEADRVAAGRDSAAQQRRCAR